MQSGSSLITAAERYGVAVVRLAQEDGSWNFDDNDATTANPRPCDPDGAQDMPYLQAVFGFLDSQPDRFGDVYTNGFSQNAMWSALAAFCFDDKVKGVWQGGSGLAVPGLQPSPPGNPCSGPPDDACEFWPVYPCYADEPMSHCVVSYSNDYLNSTTGPMWEASSLEAHDTTVLIFEPDPAQDITGGHADPRNPYDWLVGCLGVTSACSAECESSFSSCFDLGTALVDHANFAACNERVAFATLGGCTPGCAPTSTMLSLSETPSALVTSEHGRFGAGNAGLPRVQPAGSKCDAANFPGPGATDLNANCGNGPTPPPAGRCEGESPTSFCHGVRQCWGPDAECLGPATGNQ
jgi:hypothetical protein